MGFLTTEVRTTFIGKQIAAVCSEFEGSKLYIDGEVADSSGKLIMPSRKIAMLRGRIVDAEGRANVVEVYRRGFFFCRMQIRINGERVSGYQ